MLIHTCIHIDGTISNTNSRVIMVLYPLLYQRNIYMEEHSLKRAGLYTCIHIDIYLLAYATGAERRARLERAGGSSGLAPSRWAAISTRAAGAAAVDAVPQETAGTDI